MLVGLLLLLLVGLVLVVGLLLVGLLLVRLLLVWLLLVVGRVALLQVRAHQDLGLAGLQARHVPRAQRRLLPLLAAPAQLLVGGGKAVVLPAAAAAAAGGAAAICSRHLSISVGAGAGALLGAAHQPGVLLVLVLAAVAPLLLAAALCILRRCCCACRRACRRARRRTCAPCGAGRPLLRRRRALRLLRQGCDAQQLQRLQQVLVSGLGDGGRAAHAARAHHARLQVRLQQLRQLLQQHVLRFGLSRGRMDGAEKPGRVCRLGHAALWLQARATEHGSLLQVQQLPRPARSTPACASPPRASPARSPGRDPARGQASK